MKSRPIRMTDATWVDAKFIGMPEVRRLIEDAAKKKRKAIDKAKEPLASREKQKENE